MSVFNEIRKVIKNTGWGPTKASKELHIGYSRLRDVLENRKFSINMKFEEGLFMLGYRLELVKIGESRINRIQKNRCLTLDDAEWLRRQFGYSSYGEMMKDVKRLSDMFCRLIENKESQS